MEEIINENVKILNNKTNYIIEFKYSEPALVNSLIKTRIIKGGSTEGSYKNIIFKASKVTTLKEYIQINRLLRGTKTMSICEVSNMITSLVTQLNYLITVEHRTILGYKLEDIIVINEENFAFVGSDLLAELNAESMKYATIYSPFSEDSFFFSPEMFEIKELPSLVHYKTSYFSLGILIVCLITDDPDIYKDYLKHKQGKKILELLDNHTIKYTKLYWLLSRCLDEDPNSRSIFLI